MKFRKFSIFHFINLSFFISYFIFYLKSIFVFTLRVTTMIEHKNPTHPTPNVERSPYAQASPSPKSSSALKGVGSSTRQETNNI